MNDFIIYLKPQRISNMMMAEILHTQKFSIVKLGVGFFDELRNKIASANQIIQ